MTRKGKVVDEYIRQLADLGISLHSLKLLGDFEIPEQDKKLTERELIEKILTDSSYQKQKETIEKYISEFIRADLITQSTHLRRGKDLVKSNDENKIDGGVYLYRTSENDKDGSVIQVPTDSNNNTENETGYIFVGESHIHKLEEALTQNDIFVENPSTYVSNTIYSGSTEYKYEYGTSGNATGGNLFFIHTLYNGTEPEYDTNVSTMTQNAFPDWLYTGDGTSNGITTYQGTATAFERIKKIISNNSNIKNWNVVVMQGYSSALAGQSSWDSYLNNLNSMKSELSGLGGNLYVSSTPHSNAGVWQQDTCYSYGSNSVINNLQGPDSTDNNATYDQYNQYIKNGFSNFINVTSSGASNPRGKDGNEYRKYTQVKSIDTSFCFDNYAHIDLNHYDSSTMYAWCEYIINRIDGNASTTSGNLDGGNTTIVKKDINTSNYGLTAEEVTIKMDNIKNEYKIAWISDLHMMQPNESNVNNEWYTNHSTTFEQRNNSFNNSYNILPRIIECLNGNEFDAIVFGGDIMDNYSEDNFNYLKEQINKITNKNIMFLVADHDYLTEMTTNSGVNKAATSLGVSGDIKQITIGKNGDSISLVGQNCANERISDSNINTIGSYLNNASDSLFFTHVPVESKTQSSQMQAWSREKHNNQVYYWSNEATSEGYKNPPENYLNTLYNSSSLRGVFAGHVHATGDFELNNGIKEHIFNASFNNSIGVITITPSQNSSTNTGNTNIGNSQTTTNSTNTQTTNTSLGIQEVNQDKYVQMEYESPEKFQELVNNNNKDIRYKYTIDEDGNVVIAQLKTVVTKTKEGGSLFSSTDKVTTVEGVLHIDYKQYIEKYTMPYEFLINLCMVTQNPEFVYHVAMLARETNIMLVVQDDTTIEDITTKVKSKQKRYKNTSSSLTSGASVTSEKTEEIETQVITTTMVPHLEIKSANTWSFYEEYEYTKTIVTDGPNVDGPNTYNQNLPHTLPEHHPSTTEQVLQLDMTYTTVTVPEYWTGGPWEVEREVTTTTTTTTKKYNPGLLVNSIEKSKQFLGLLRNSTGECKEPNCYNDPDKVKKCVRLAEFDRNGYNVEYAIPNSTNVDAPLNRLISGLQMLYQLLGEGLQGESGDEQKDEINSEYKTKMTGIVDHIKYLMTFPDNEDIDIQYEDDYEDSVDIPAPDIKYDNIENDELQVLYKICEAEAGAYSESEITHVACVILNRVKCSQWPNTIIEVVFQENQFQPVRNGRFDAAVPSEKTKRAVDAAISGGDTTGGAVYFRTEASAIAAGMPTSKNETHKSYIYLFTDPNTHVFHTTAKALEELRGSSGETITTPATGDLKALFPDGIPTTEAGIRKYLVTVQVPVTKKDGTKTTAPVTIHKDVAEDLKRVLQKAQDEGFKVYGIGGFVWRNIAHSSRISQHALGLAVDINVTENYCVYPSTGQVDAGSFWDPSRSEYSIPKDGVLVKAFKSIGWGWGGDWKSKKDYMHFSATGK